MALPTILLIDDNQLRTQQFKWLFDFLEYEVKTTTATQCDIALQHHAELGAVFIGGGEKQGALVKSIADRDIGAPLFLLVDKDNQALVSSNLQKMVDKVQEWPTTYPRLSELFSIIQEASDKRRSSGAYRQRSNKGLSGNSVAVRQIRDLIDQVAASDATVLILGESGTGKEVIAQALHRHSRRNDRPFVPVNCGAIPGELLESELFGHEKGAFTGALTSREGRFEMAEGGTLFLDEIGDMPMPMQVKLLRVLQERTFERVGSNKTVHCDVRVIAATHRHLEEEIKEKRFREDLFYRLNVFPIEVPALRERAEDIPYLINDLIGRMKGDKRGAVTLSHAATAVLMQHDWPGNVRELSNLIERLAILYPNGFVDAADLPEKFHAYEIPEQIEPVISGLQQEEVLLQQSYETTINETQVTPITHLPEQGMDLKEYLSDLESGLIKQALQECNGVVAHAAKLLHMRRTTLVEKLRKYDLS